MQYPEFLKKDDLIGITAASCGCGSDVKETKISFNHLKEHFKLIVTPNVYGDYSVSSSKDLPILYKAFINNSLSKAKLTLPTNSSS